MAKHLSPEQRKDKTYAEQMLRDFVFALRNGDKDEAEECYNEMTGVMNVMMERLDG